MMMKEWNSMKTRYTKSWRLPTQLHKGMTIAVVSGHTMSSAERLHITLLWQALGYQLIWASSSVQTSTRVSQEVVMDELNHYMTSADCDAVMVSQDDTIGIKALARLDYERIRYYHKPCIGANLCTMFHRALHQESRLITYHGLSLAEQGRCTVEEAHMIRERLDQPHVEQVYVSDAATSMWQLVALVEGKSKVIEPLPEPPRGMIGTELGMGRLLGGSLSSLCALQDTPYRLRDDEATETILWVHTEKSEVKLLSQRIEELQKTDVLGWVQGIAVSGSIDCDDIGFDLLRCMEESRRSSKGEPFVCYLPTNREGRCIPLPLGATVNFRYISNTLLYEPYCKRQ